MFWTDEMNVGSLMYLLDSYLKKHFTQQTNFFKKPVL